MVVSNNCCIFVLETQRLPKLCYWKQNTNDMKTTDRLIEMINDKINQYVHKCRLFSGGCCYSAYVIARSLKMAGIKYRTVVWQSEDILKVRSFNKAVNGCGCAHVGIEVKYQGKWSIIGDCSGINTYFMVTGEKVNIRTYHRVEPEIILDGYKNNEWNCTYDTHNNGPLSRDINKIVLKYFEEIA